MSSNEPIVKRRRWPARLAWTAGIVLILAVVARLIVAAWGHSLVSSAQAIWDADPDYQAVSAMKSWDTNDSARRLGELCRAIGINMTPKGQEDSERPLAVEYPSTSAHRWLKTVLAANDPLEPPPPEFVAFLDEHAADIDAVVAHLRERERPRWKFDAGAGLDGRLPNLLGHVHLSRLLLAGALLDDASGRAERSEARLDAAWKLSESLDERQELLSRLVHFSRVRQLAATLRRIDVPAQPWVDRLASIEPRADVRRAFASEAMEGLVSAPGRAIPTDSSQWDLGDGTRRLANAMGLPTLVLGRAAKLQHDLVTRIDSLAPCTDDPSAVQTEWEDGLGLLDTICTGAVASMGTGWTRALQSETEIALARAVLEARHARATGTRAPAKPRLPCEALSISEEPTPDGGFRMSVVGTIAWTISEQGQIVSLTHVEPGPPTVTALASP